MPRHPVYLLLCLGACAYVLFANARGYSPFATGGLRSGPSGPGGARLIHK